jgi:hypothetical protein
MAIPLVPAIKIYHISGQQPAHALGEGLVSTFKQEMKWLSISAQA